MNLGFKAPYFRVPKNPQTSHIIHPTSRFAIVFRSFVEKICFHDSCFLPLHQKTNDSALDSYDTYRFSGVLIRLVVFLYGKMILGLIGARREDGPQWLSSTSSLIHHNACPTGNLVGISDMLI